MLDFSLLDKIYLSDREQAVDDILSTYKKHGSCIVHFLYFANLMHDRLVEGAPKPSQKAYLHALSTGDFCFADGIALQLFYRWVKKTSILPPNLNGTDFIPYLFDHISTQYHVSVYIYQCYDPPKGKDASFLKKGQAALKQRFPEFTIQRSAQCLYREKGKNFDWDGLRQSATTDSSDIKVFFNCTGSPFQEIWSAEHEQQLRDGGFLVINAGGTIDYITGFEQRAPKWVVKARVLETFWRICTHPRKNLKKFLWMFGVFRVIWSALLLKLGLR